MRPRHILLAAVLAVVAFSLYQGLRAGLATLFYSQAKDEIDDGDQARGTELLERAAGWDEEHRASRLLLARRHMGLRDLQHARFILEQLQQSGDDSPDVFDLLGRVAFGLGDAEFARRTYERFAQKHPGDIAAQVGLTRAGAPLPPELLALTRSHGAHKWRAPIRGFAILHLDDELGGRGYGTLACVQSMAEIRRIGGNAISLRVPGRQPTIHDTTITFDQEAPGGEQDSTVRATIRDAHALGLKVMLKPHIMLGRISDAEWRGTLGFDDPAKRDAWWCSYEAFILHYARFATAEAVETLCVGVELRTMVAQSPQRWIDLIGKVREVYPGRLTYAANWYHEYAEVPFWGLLDAIGVQFFFPITDVENPDVDTLKQGLAPRLTELRELSDFLGRPVLFTEVGYKSTAGAAREPWVWPQEGQRPDAALQARAYRAILESLWNEPWTDGIYWWNWLTEPEPGEKFQHDFTPQGKPAVATINEFWGRIGE